MNEKLGFTSWIKKYPTKAVLFLLLILIPLLTITLIGINYNKKGKSFYFDTKDNEEVLLTQRDVAKKKEINKYFDDFNVTLKEVSKVTKEVDGETVEIEYGKFKFDIDYILSSNYKKSNVQLRYVMTANWFNEQSSVTSNKTIEFPYNLPKRKNVIFKVGKPILYIEITIDRPFSNINESKTITIYHKYDLNNVKYTNVK